MEEFWSKFHIDGNIITECNHLLSYIPNFLGQMSDSYLDLSLELDSWRQDHILLFGRQYKLPRLTLWYSATGRSYTYSGITMTGKPYPAFISRISNHITRFSGLRFNSVLLNRYRTGADKIGWHSDKEKCLGETINIATISLGSKRTLLVKKSGAKKFLKLELEHGSLLLMKNPFQKTWLHCIPPRKHQSGERISLTFRKIEP